MIFYCIKNVQTAILHTYFLRNALIIRKIKDFFVDLLYTQYFPNQILIANTKMRWSPSIFNTRTFSNFFLTLSYTKQKINFFYKKHGKKRIKYIAKGMARQNDIHVLVKPNTKIKSLNKELMRNKFFLLFLCAVNIFHIFLLSFCLLFASLSCQIKCFLNILFIQNFRFFLFETDTLR